jgi:hypothetical protein
MTNSRDTVTFTTAKGSVIVVRVDGANTRASINGEDKGLVTILRPNPSYAKVVFNQTPAIAPTSDPKIVDLLKGIEATARANRPARQSYQYNMTDDLAHQMYNPNGKLYG